MWVSGRVLDPTLHNITYDSPCSLLSDYLLVGASVLDHSISTSSIGMFQFSDYWDVYLVFFLSLDPFAVDEDCPSADEPSSEMIEVNQDFTRLNDKFYAISQSLFRHLEDSHVHPRDVRTHLTVLDSMILIKEASAIVDTVSDKLETKGTLSRLYNFLNSSVWNFIDYHLLEYIIKKFGNEDLKRRMAQYICDLLTFEKHTTITQLIEVWDKQDLVPKDCEDATATVKIDKDPTRVTISDLNTLRKKICGEFWPRLSEYASYVLHNCKLKIGCFIVTWRFNSSLRSELEEKACKAHDFFEKNQVLSFSIGKEDIYVSKSKFTPGILFHLNLIT